MNIERRNFLRLAVLAAKTGCAYTGTMLLSPSFQQLNEQSAYQPIHSQDTVSISQNLPMIVGEEIVYRGLPSALAELTSEQSDAPARNIFSRVVFGRLSGNISRRGLLIGAASSLAFVAHHSSLQDSRFVRGIYYWVLARTCGVPASAAAHLAYNEQLITTNQD